MMLTTSFNNKGLNPMSHPFKPVKDLISVHRLTGGRCLVVGHEVSGLANKVGDAGLERCAERLITRAEHYENTRIRRRVQRGAKGDGRATEVDRVLDNVLRMMNGHLEGLETALEGLPLHEKAVAVRAACFPEGLRAVISVPYEDELIQVRRIERILTDEGDAVIDGLGIRWHLSEIQRLLPDYADALAARRLVTSGDLTHAREQMHVALCAVVAWIIAHYFEEPQHGQRDMLLAPVLEQQARLSALMRARRLGRTSATPEEESDSIDEIAEAEAELDAAGEGDADPDDPVDDGPAEGEDSSDDSVGDGPAVLRPITPPGGRSDA